MCNMVFNVYLFPHPAGEYKKNPTFSFIKNVNKTSRFVIWGFS